MERAINTAGAEPAVLTLTDRAFNELTYWHDPQHLRYIELFAKGLTPAEISKELTRSAMIVEHFIEQFYAGVPGLEKCDAELRTEILKDAWNQFEEAGRPKQERPCVILDPEPTKEPEEEAAPEEEDPSAEDTSQSDANVFVPTPEMKLPTEQMLMKNMRTLRTGERLLLFDIVFFDHDPSLAEVCSRAKQYTSPGSVGAIRSVLYKKLGLASPNGYSRNTVWLEYRHQLLVRVCKAVFSANKVA